MIPKASRPLVVPPQIMPMGTRDAVETAIDLSKGDRSTPWEESAYRSRSGIDRWRTDTAECAVPSEDAPCPEKK
jgi:hypothetical protein